MSVSGVFALAFLLAQAEPTAAEREASPPAVAVRPFEMPAVVPVESDVPAVVLPEAPVRLEDYRGQYEPPKDVVQLRFERGVADNLRRAAALSGPLEGAWRVVGEDGAPLLGLVLFHTGEGGAGLDGAWRDLRRPGPLGASGPLLWATRDGAGVVILHFRPYASDGPAVLTLAPSGARWTGSLAVPGAPPQRVVLTPDG